MLRRAILGLLAWGLALLLVPLGAVSAQPLPTLPEAVPEPEADPFYAVPADIARYQRGDVIASRKVTAALLGIPVAGELWQVKYRTEDSKNQPSATVTTVIVPRADWTGSGPRPLVSYQTAEDGVAGRCAPSYQIRAGVPDGLGAAYGEIGLMNMAAQRGWIVAVPDYEGPRSEFLVAGTQAKAVLDGIRAVRRFAPAGLRATGPVGLWGYSGGSLASMTAAQLQPTYAPELRLSGLAVGGLLADIRSTIDAFSGSAFGGAIPMGINGFLRAYPELNIGSYLSASGRKKVADTSRDCIAHAVPRYPFLEVADIEAVPNALGRPPIAAMLRNNSPVGLPNPRVPIHHYHAGADELAPIAPARLLMQRFCRAGLTVQSKENPLGEHLTEIVVGAPAAVEYLADRFAGEPAPNTCGRILG